MVFDMAEVGGWGKGEYSVVVGVVKACDGVKCLKCGFLFQVAEQVVEVLPREGLRWRYHSRCLPARFRLKADLARVVSRLGGKSF